ncbi:MAG TPA: ribosome biogenesis GTP-binding protein YihA/YsxC [Lentimicrobium sp.]|nr:ribosome biogenesis GTP-binding protein YihA/YsxC [Lentimicrobium sp.]
MIIRTADFLVSNTNPSRCPAAEMPEYAFIGRSNVGKSSLINMLLGRKNLARTSSTPGKTRLINHFVINGEWYLVDLPGYGYARISKTEREKWETMIRNYLRRRSNLVTTFILVDSRIEPKQVDIDFINWCGEEQIPFTIVFTKADKISDNQLASNLSQFMGKLTGYWEELPQYLVTSSETARGKDEVHNLIELGNEAFRSFSKGNT